jgi:hypothetical protein
MGKALDKQRQSQFDPAFDPWKFVSVLFNKK